MNKLTSSTLATDSFDSENGQTQSWTVADGPFCGNCRKPCKVDAYSDSEGDPRVAMRYFRVVESACCGAHVFTDPDCRYEYQEDV